MALFRNIAAAVSLLFSLLLLHLTQAEELMSLDGAPRPSPQAQSLDANYQRGQICAKGPLGSCCAKCKCVSPGAAGNHHYYPCYANLTTRNKVHKCP